MAFHPPDCGCEFCVELRAWDREEELATAGAEGWIALYEGGMTAVDIARLAHVRIETVSAALRQAGVLDPAGRSAIARSGKRPQVWAPSRWKADLPDTAVAYIAGLLDGEGSITHQVMKYAGWRVEIAQLASTGLGAWLAETTGAGVLARDNRPSRGNPMATGGSPASPRSSPSWRRPFPTSASRRRGRSRP